MKLLTKLLTRQPLSHKVRKGSSSPLLWIILQEISHIDKSSSKELISKGCKLGPRDLKYL